MRSVGLQPPTIPRPCFICRTGLNGRAYCYYCGNTKDLGGNIGGGNPYRSTADVTRCMGAPVGLRQGTSYSIEVTITGERTKLIEGVCEAVRGPLAVVEGNTIHLLDIVYVKEIS